MKPSEESSVFVDNVAMVQSQDTTSLAVSWIPMQDFLTFAGDVSQTVSLSAVPRSSGEKCEDRLGLFGSWQEAKNEEEELQGLYRSRLVTSSAAVEDE